MKNGVITENGATFASTHPIMDSSYVRFRVPANPTDTEEIGRRLDFINNSK